jgi:predicted phage-related endonuclease
MLADLDGVIYENGKMNLFEAKTASAYKQEIWEKGIPEEYVLQVQHYMAVTGAEKTYLAALVGGNRFYWKVVRRDEQKIAEIIALEKAFWEENVLAGKEPVPDGSGATTDFLNEKYSSSNGNTILLPEEALGLCRRYEELSGQLNELQDKKDAVSNQLKNFLKNNESGVIGEYRVTWKQVTSTTFDKKRLEKENRALYEEYLTKKQYRRLTVA